MNVLEMKYQEQALGDETATPAAGAPRMAAMDVYLLRRHKRLIHRAANAWRRAHQSTGRHHTRMVQMAFWWVSAETVLADVTVEIREAEGGVTRLYCEVWVELGEEVRVRCGECGPEAERPDRLGWRLSRYLVPLLDGEALEEGAEALLRRYCPEAMEKPAAHSAMLLAERLGLQVLRCPLYQRSRTRSILFFRAGRVMAAQTDHAGMLLEEPHPVQVPAGTIVLNANAVHRDYGQTEIYHECIHYAWHRMFFRLQALQHSDVTALRARMGTTVPDVREEQPLRWMEWQARRGSAALMAPLSIMRPLIGQLQAEASPELHPGARWDWIARRIAQARDWPKYRVRARLIQMGHVEARGALNYVDGAYIPPFSFAREAGAAPYTFVIDRGDALRLYREDPAFRRLLRTGRYVYAQGHVCIHDPAYVRPGAHGLALTPWALAHADQCCMRFRQVYEPAGLSPCRLGEINCDEEYSRHYLDFAGPGRQPLLQMAQLLEKLPPAFPEALTFLMRRAHVTIEQLEERACISGRTISRLRTEERSSYALDQVIALCVALHLPPWLSREMLQRAGLLLRRTKQHLAYRCILDCMFMDEVEDVQRYLAQAGLEKLRLGGGE